MTDHQADPPAVPVGQRLQLSLSEGLSWLVLLGALVFGTWIVTEALRQQAWLSSSFALRFRTSNATGLWPGVHVTISGYRVGRVEQVQLGPDGSVAVDLRIAERYRPLIGPASRALRYQEGLIGSSLIALSADPVKAGQSPAKTDRLIPFDESPDLAKLLVQIGETRLVLNRALQGTAAIAERDLPGAIAGFNGTLGDMSRLSRRVEQESGTTAASARDTLQEFKRTGQRLESTGAEAQEATAEALRLIRDTQPEVVGAIREIRTLAERANHLLGVPSAAERAPASPAAKP
ncbi:MlaD family protein [Synechococcus sp. RedBA-s]|uniref:MlaD family protein n=1 Tax=Synechococcus sp. RedBA-s TaxID=2823741 RepID=UPI0020CC0FE5|nr:MlaD family protein [Synechococcus sp. RedBA-s]MCP9800838.1 MCE family protein [Synechococcus sp. RedBA-s]